MLTSHCLAPSTQQKVVARNIRLYDNDILIILFDCFISNGVRLVAGFWDRRLRETGLGRTGGSKGMGACIGIGAANLFWSNVYLGTWPVVAVI